MDKSIRFWNRFAKRYAKQAISDPDAYEHKLALTRPYLHADASCLEFGCGTGSTALLHAPRVKSILAIDTSSKMIEIANRKVREQGIANVEFRETDLFALPDTDESYDVVLALNILHLMPDYAQVIRKTYAMLKPGGVFVSSSACIADGAKLLQWVLPWIGKTGLVPQVKAFTRDELKSQLTGAGFVIEKEYTPEKSQSTCFLIATKPGSV